MDAQILWARMMLGYIAAKSTTPTMLWMPQIGSSTVAPCMLHQLRQAIGGQKKTNLIESNAPQRGERP